MEIVQDAGAYPQIGAVLPFLTIMMATGPYAIRRAEAVGVSVVTSTTPVGAYRGAGRPEATAALERAFDLFAAEIGADPASVRRRNLLPAFTEPYETAFGALYDSGDYAVALERAFDLFAAEIGADPASVRRRNLLPAFTEPYETAFGALYDSGDYAVALDKALGAAGYTDLRAEQASRRTAGDTAQLGIGLSCYVEITGGGDEAGAPSENAAVEVHSDGTATILTGTSPH